MKNVMPFVLVLFSMVSCAQEQEEEQGHWNPTHNFTVQRLIILNDQGEMLLGRQDHVWASPALIFDERLYSNESMENLAKKYGIQIDQVELHGYFGFKYEYHPFATRRAYYTAKYVSGKEKIAEGDHEVGWFPIEEALAKINVTAIQQITQQIVMHPNTVWGGSFMVYRDGENHPTKMVEPFYALFGSK